MSEEKYYSYDGQYYKVYLVCDCKRCEDRGFYEPFFINVNNPDEEFYVTSSSELASYKEIQKEDVVLYDYIVDLGRNQYLSKNGDIVCLFSESEKKNIPSFKYYELKNFDERWLPFAKLK